MGFWDWLDQNWFILLQSAGIIGGLLFTAFAMRSDEKTRRIGNDLLVTQNHRDIWKETFRRPDLLRVLDASVDLKQTLISREEEIFVNLVILHLNSVLHAMKDKLVPKPEGLQKDVGSFFTLPIPHAVWNQMKSLHDVDFVKFVESCWTEKMENSS
jgi:hypothetical protein